MRKYRIPVRFTGQHFTIDTHLIKDAIRLANLQKEDLVLDIGAGRGFLTAHLLKYSDNVIAIENDRFLISELRSRFKFIKTVKVIQIDFRKFLAPQKPFKVVSNIPFAITSDILKSLMFNNLQHFSQGCLILQLEPAQKLVQQKMFNPYVVFYHTFFDLELMYEINPDSFIPPPKVKSALLKISKKKTENINAEMKEKYLDFLYFILKFPDLPIRTALKKIFRKKQIDELSEKYDLKPGNHVCEVSAQEFSVCFVEMLRIVPDKFHPTNN